MYNHSPPEGMNLHTQTHEYIVNSNINKKISDSISASNPNFKPNCFNQII